MLETLPSILEELGVRQIFLVTGNQSYFASGLEKAFLTMISPYKVIRFSDFNPNPSLPDIIRGLSLFKKNSKDVVIAAGGGTVIDMAKSIRVLSVQSGPPETYIREPRKISAKGVPLIAIPTTAGSGSEATHFAVVYIDHEKFSLAHENVYPNYAIVDPNLTFSLPRDYSAFSGMDAFSQAVESYWAVNSTQESKQYAREAISLVLNNLVKAVNHPTPDSRVAMAKAAHLAGKAINISKTTAAHALSYPFTSHFGVPHGYAVALTLGEVFTYNSQARENDCNDPRGVEYVHKAIEELLSFFDCYDHACFKEFLTRLMTAIGLETKLSSLNIELEKHLDYFQREINLERLQNNPRSFTFERITELLKAVL